MIIGENEIHVWLVYDEKMCNENIISDYFSILSSEEKYRQKRFYFDSHRRQYLITRAFVRSTLSHYNSFIDPSSWRFCKNEYGKPSIENRLDIPLNFNVSHTKGMIALAVSRGAHIGIDLEWKLRESTPLDIARNYFSSLEVRNLFSLPEDQRINRFFDLWTLKESYVKACGMGLSIPLDQFSFSFYLDRYIGISFDEGWSDNNRNYFFYQYDINRLYRMSLCIREKDALLSDYSLTFLEAIPMKNFFVTPLNPCRISNFL
ncbi:4'-phosphopantetheinyl transferase family protein [Microbulbifer sp. ZKSA006]|uniref:4'-phosphopantetheinyl transferase family protein n=1 Tax=Microbulbifer sp. ZKSA006 TaxID=3243390 RepID=UPI00403A378B